MPQSRSDRFVQRRRANFGPHESFEPRERRAFGNEDFSQEREDWREPQDIGERERFEFERGPQYGRGSASQYGVGGGGRDARGPFTGKGPKGYRRSDERIQEDVSQALSDHPELDASEIEVSVENGEVTLKGTVDERRAKRMAEECIEHVPGVHDVRNEIRMTNHGGSGRDDSRAR
ncbi:MAG TPA: BON domain-containing protein [Myxococcota bacterium]|nr:BON domain-containing protein [Myxococcota bacterium]